MFLLWGWIDPIFVTQLHYITIYTTRYPSTGLKASGLPLEEINKQDIYYHKDGANVSVTRLVEDQLLGLLIGQAFENQMFEQIPKFIVPVNLYSCVDDSGVTALELIKALMKISPLPVVSDIQMTPQAKRFLEKQIDRHTLIARTLNLVAAGGFEPPTRGFDLDYQN